MVQERIDIHDYAEQFQRALRLVETATLSDGNKLTLRSFANRLRVGGIGLARVIKYVGTMRLVGEALGKNFEDASKEDLESFMLAMTARPDLSPWTKRDYAVTIRKFYSWLQGDGTKPPEKVACIATTVRKKDKPHIRKSELLTEEDVRQLLKASRNPRDRAFILLLWDTGARIGELGSMRIGDITFQDQYTLLDMRGKTGARTVLACESTRALLAWLEVHPMASDLSAPLWVAISGRVSKVRRPMKYSALRAVVEATLRRTDLKKRFYPHLFRHSRATWCVEHGWSSYQLCRHFGWELDSVMPAVYLSLSDKLVHDKMLETYGVKQDKVAERTPPCVRCGGHIPSGTKFCPACGMSIGTSPNYSELLARESTEQKLAVLLREPAVRNLFLQALADCGLSAFRSEPEGEAGGETGNSAHAGGVTPYRRLNKPGPDSC